MSLPATDALQLSCPIIYSAQRPPDYQSLFTLLNQIDDMKNELTVLSRTVAKLTCPVPTSKKTEPDHLLANPTGYNVTLTTQTSPKNTYVKHLKVPESQNSFTSVSSYNILNHAGLNSELNNTSENSEKHATGINEKHRYQTCISSSMVRPWNKSIIEEGKTIYSQIYSGNLSSENRISVTENYQGNTTDAESITNMYRDSNSFAINGRKEGKKLSPNFPSLRKDFEETKKDKFLPAEERKESNLSDDEKDFMPTYISALKIVTSRPPSTKRTMEFLERSTSKSYFDFADYYLKILDLHDKASKRQKSATLVVSTNG